MREGDVALMPLPQADGQSKPRPVLLLRKMPPFGDWLVCGISTQPRTNRNFERGERNGDATEIGAVESEVTEHTKVNARATEEIIFPGLWARSESGETNVARFDSREIIETICSEDRQKRAFITKDEKGLYRLYMEWWDTSDWAAGHGARWDGGYAGSLTDSLERARELAREEMGVSASSALPGFVQNLNP